MRRALILAFLLATGCAGGHEAREPSWSQNPGPSDRYEAAHPSATPSRRRSDDTGPSILDGMLGSLFGGN